MYTRPNPRTNEGHNSLVTENTVAGPISTKAITAAEGALRWIAKVPGGDKVQVRIGGALEVIKALSVTGPHDANTMRWLEYHLQYLVELLEPFAMMHRSQISSLLQYEVLMLGRELETASLKVRPITAPDEATMRKSMHTKQHEELDSTGPDIRAFRRDFKSALDQFRANALPLYPVSPIEAGLLPLGVISHSSCALAPFLDWILKSGKVVNYRIGVVRSVELYHRPRLTGDQRDWRFMLVCLENGRQIENWIKIELSGPDTQGTVTFGTTKETLHEGLPSNSDFAARIAEDTLSVTRFSR
ncbi:hypothetical protein BS47DRAFT_1383631, partial [Hydnum rufescens UP504]